MKKRNIFYPVPGNPTKPNFAFILILFLFLGFGMAAVKTVEKMAAIVSVARRSVFMHPIAPRKEVVRYKELDPNLSFGSSLPTPKKSREKL